MYVSGRNSLRCDQVELHQVLSRQKWQSDQAFRSQHRPKGHDQGHREGSRLNCTVRRKNLCISMTRSKTFTKAIEGMTRGRHTQCPKKERIPVEGASKDQHDKSVKGKEEFTWEGSKSSACDRVSRLDFQCPGLLRVPSVEEHRSPPCRNHLPHRKRICCLLSSRPIH